MKFSTAILGAISLPLINAAVLFKRSEPIHFQYYDYDNSWLSGQAKVNLASSNCGRTLPKLEMYWAQGDSWQPPVEARKVAPAWQEWNPPYAFRVYAENATQFYIKYTCGAQESFDPKKPTTYPITPTTWG